MDHVSIPLPAQWSTKQSILAKVLYTTKQTTLLPRGYTTTHYLTSHLHLHSKINKFLLLRIQSNQFKNPKNYHIDLDKVKLDWYCVQNTPSTLINTCNRGFCMGTLGKNRWCNLEEIGKEFSREQRRHTKFISRFFSESWRRKPGWLAKGRNWWDP